MIFALLAWLCIGSPSSSAGSGFHHLNVPAKTVVLDGAHTVPAYHSHADPPVEWRYTASGRRDRMFDASGETIYGYDDRDRLTSKATPQGTLGYSYDDAGNLTSISTNTPDGASMTYEHDALNRLDTVTDANGQLTDYSYDAVGNLQSVALPNGITAGYGYNAVNRLTTLMHSRQSIGDIASYNYGLNPTGHRRAAFEGGAAISGTNPAQTRAAVYDYDALWRLKAETITGDPAGKNGQVTYGYDAVGNRELRSSSIAGLTNQAFSYDANDRLNGDTYDANGNTVSGRVGVPPSGLGVSPGPILGADTYDSHDRLIRRSGTLNSQPSSLNILYNGDGHKVQESVTRNGITTVTSYLVDELNPTGYAQVVEEKTNGALTRVYTYGHDLISQDQLVGSDWTLSYYGYDGHGNVRFLTNAAGEVTDRYTYDAFGQLLSTTGPTANRYLYCGEQYDAELGLYYLRARLMNPLTGRFWTSDAYEGQNSDPASLHKYLYANADPVNLSDPSGYTSLSELSVGSAIRSTNSFKPALSRAAITAGINIIMQARIAAIVGPFSAQLKVLAAEIDSVDPTGRGSATLHQLTAQLDRIVSLPQQTANVLLPTLISALPGMYGMIGGAAFSMVRGYQLNAAIVSIAVAASEGTSFEAGWVGVNIQAPITNNAARLASGKVFLGMLDPTEEIAVPLTDMVQSLKGRRVHMAEAYAENVASNLFLYGVGAVHVRGHVSTQQFQVSRTSPWK